MQPRPEWLRKRLADAPKKPGCYLMKDERGAVVYVGKANNLKARLAQYFAPNPGDTRFFVRLLGDTLGAIELIVASNPKEALLLENQLIKRYKPRFNVKLKDDKSFLKIRIRRADSKQPFPRLEVVRKRSGDSADYFGPYDSASAIRNTVRVINRHFQLRTCSDVEFRNRTRPCLEHQIGRCPAPCVLPVSTESYAESLHDVRLFLSGRSKTLIARLRDKMNKAASETAYELAAHYRDQLTAIERSLVPQRVQLKQRQDIDVLGLARNGEKIIIQMLQLRAGTLLGSRSFPIQSECDDIDVVEDFLGAYYNGQRPVPDLVLTAIELPEAALWSELLGETRGKRVHLYSPQRGDKKHLVELASDNASESLKAANETEEEKLNMLQDLQRRLGLKNFPERIECYDISNIQGTDPVGSLVCALSGSLATSETRRFKVRTLDYPNDFQMMYEVLSRRFRHSTGLEEEKLPDLLLVDGGKGQLNIAVEVLRELGLHDIDVASLAKSRVLEASSQARPSSADPSRSRERVFRPGRKNPVLLRPNSSTLHLLQRLRDEAHRVAISHHRIRRTKRTLGSELDAIDGVGPSRRRALLSHLGSLKAIRGATVNELAACPGISAALAARIHKRFNPSET